MIVIEPSTEILSDTDPNYIVTLLEKAGRVCYKSEDKITEGSALDFLRRVIKSGHESVIEHISVTVKLTCDRGITHELVRHRLCSFSQESTRYANYSKEKFGREITVIRPSFWRKGSASYMIWKIHMKECEDVYMDLLDQGAKAQEARSVLPNSLKADIVMTCNLREWRQIFKLRCGKAAHPQMREVMLPLLAEMHRRIPVIFDDLFVKHYDDIRGK